MTETAARTEILTPYVPRLMLAWVADGFDERHLEIDGTLVFIDISGFTKLSERLAKLGKRGAEEVAAAIGGCFESLLAVAYERGGGLIKFGGDALLMLFDGPDHAFRGAAAALEMRATLRRVGDLRTPGGRVVLRMSVGVHTGTFTFFAAGQSHRELVITGPAATQTVTMESNADAGDVLVSDATAALLPSRMLGARKGPGTLLRASSTIAPPEPIPTFPISVDATGCVPVAIRSHLLGGGDAPEHRLVSAAFIHFDEIDEMVENEGLGVVAERLDGLVRCVQEACEEGEVTFLGTDVDKDGGKIICVSGAPMATEDDEERMLLTLRRIMDTNDSLPIRIGANRGYVFAGDVGPSYRRTYTIMGDPVNLAARVMAAAEPGQILVTEAILLSSRATFDTVALPPFFVKGKANAVEAFALGAATGGKTSEERRLLPLVGRDDEMELLRYALEAARSRRGGVVELVGDPGIGKSRLVEEARVRANDMTILATTSELYAAGIPYAAFRQLLLTLLGLPADVAADVAIERLRDRVRENAPQLIPWLPLIGIPLDLELPPTPETQALDEAFVRSRLHDVVSDLLELLLPTPTLLVFEDVHYLDEASAELLEHLGRLADREPWAVIVTRRNVETGFVAPGDLGSMRIGLEPLTFEEAITLVHVASEDAERPLSEHDARVLAERAAGNPLFLEALVSEALSLGSVEALPDSVGAAITARLDRLTPRDRGLLRHASVIGTSFSVDLLQEVSDGVVPGADDDAWARLGEFLVQERFAVFRFPHALVRDAAYEGLPFRKRQELHGRAGDAILASAGDPDDVSEALSLHFFHAERFDAAWIYSRIAGERAAAKFSNVEAASYFERALKSASRVQVPTEERAAVAERLGDVWTRAGEFGRAGQALRDARRLAADDPVREARLRLKQAWIPHRTGRFSEAMRWISRGLKALDGVDTTEAKRQRAELFAWYSVMRRSQGKPGEAIRWTRRAIDEARASDAREALALAYSTEDLSNRLLGRPDAGEMSTAALEIYEALGDLGGQAVVLNNLGTFAYYDGRWDEARALYDRSREARERTGDPVNAAFGTINVAEILSDQGHLEEAEELGREALRVWRAAGDRDGIAFATSLLGRVASRRHRFDDADALFEAARAEFADIGSDADVLETDIRVAESLVFRREPARALDILEDVGARAKASEGIGAVHEPMIRRVRGLALLQLGRLDEAATELAMSVRSARENGSNFDVALGIRAAAELAAARGTVAVDAVSESDEILKRLGVVAVPGVATQDEVTILVDDVTVGAS